ncbi:LytTR family transcriptional regulator DNA-binding domain-containing protein [Alkalicoccobacillus plakortidis]|uniref:LytTR family transcriptional regulator DNA-binding domain-containing protein n=1 Tax=Alkalicoccobacillus plakortidis TaxID=444060 RepID=A0ABT0XIG4_9BACI|nr:LytTR family transcriptional regulator DNA-binding domain-containing protein [Alkalicoccobacillus plakortidis]MCM2675555.1 LytTR family transcriptional regulator DNA-binding domain-containing protein [Alkalicoccobacillus plakortidis]
MISVERILKFERHGSTIYVQTEDERYRLMRSLEDLDNWLKDFTSLDRANLVNMKKVVRLSKSNKLVFFSDVDGHSAKVSRRNLSKIVKLKTDNRSH